MKCSSFKTGGLAIKQQFRIKISNRLNIRAVNFNEHFLFAKSWLLCCRSVSKNQLEPIAIENLFKSVLACPLLSVFNIIGFLIEGEIIKWEYHIDNGSHS